jgi:hypothetical protein
MKKEIADKWVAALRSGKYQQGTGALNSNNRFCCLGVLCDISGVGAWSADFNGTFYIIPDDQFEDSSDIYLPHGVMEWAEMDDAEGYVGFDTSPGPSHLTGMNDSGMTFEEIADVIENNHEIL